ncbi:UNVERIFIED_CONTAM: hypothetical protein K2H54_053232 [Gekko kuhli]
MPARNQGSSQQEEGGGSSWKAILLGSRSSCHQPWLSVGSQAGCKQMGASDMEEKAAKEVGEAEIQELHGPRHWFSKWEQQCPAETEHNDNALLPELHDDDKTAATAATA